MKDHIMKQIVYKPYLRLQKNKDGKGRNSVPYIRRFTITNNDKKLPNMILSPKRRDDLDLDSGKVCNGNIDSC